MCIRLRINCFLLIVYKKIINIFNINKNMFLSITGSCSTIYGLQSHTMIITNHLQIHKNEIRKLNVSHILRKNK